MRTFLIFLWIATTALGLIGGYGWPAALIGGMALGELLLQTKRG